MQNATKYGYSNAEQINEKDVFFYHSDHCAQQPNYNLQLAQPVAAGEKRQYR